jgi:hypothetical protein
MPAAKTSHRTPKTNHIAETAFMDPNSKRKRNSRRSIEKESPHNARPSAKVCATQSNVYLTQILAGLRGNNMSGQRSPAVAKVAISSQPTAS